MLSIEAVADDSVIGKMYFDIPGQELQSALISFGVQAKLSVIVPVELTSDKRSTPVVGYFYFSDALKMLLGRTGLTAAFDLDKGFVEISPSIKNGMSLESESSVYEPRLEEVFVVSARFREEDLRNVPMSISTYSGEELEEQGVDDLIHLGSKVPNVTLKTIRTTNSSLAAYIRGMGQEDGISGLETAVGIYIDDVYINRPQSVILDIYDVERIEVLRGPQGTLYGRNTMGGAIKYVTKDIPEDPELSLKIAGGSYNQRDIIISGGRRMDEALKIGGSIASLNRDGFGTNLTTGEEHYDKDVLSIRMNAELMLTKQLSLRLSGDKTKNLSGVRSPYNLVGDEENPPLNNIYDTRAGLSLSSHPIRKPEISMSGGSLKTQWLGERSLKFESIFSYREDYTSSPSDLDSLEVQTADLFVEYKNNQTSQEFRWTYDGANVYGLFGLYYLDANAFSVYEVAKRNSLGNGPVFGNDVESFSLTDSEVTSYSLFYNVDVDVSDLVGVSMGLRYTKEKRKMLISRNAFTADSSGELISPYFGGDGQSFYGNIPALDENGVELWPEFVGRRTDSAVTPKMSVSLRPSISGQVYFAYSSGFKGGGFAPRASFTDETKREGYDPEQVDSYEVGAKYSFWDDSVDVTASFFYNDYRNMQLLSAVDDDVQGNRVTTNAEKSHIVGAELELKTNYRGYWFSDFSIGFLRPEFDEYIDGAGRDVASSREFISTPKISVLFSQEFRKVFNSGTWSWYGELSYQSETTFFSSPSTPVDQAGYSIINMTFLWRPKNEQWLAGVSVLNLGGKKYYVGALYESEETEYITRTGLTSVFWGDPRTVSASVKYKF